MIVTYASTVISFIALIVYSGLLFILLRQNIRSKVRFFFGLYLASMIIWSFSSLMIFTTPDIGAVLFWNRFLLIGSIAMPIALFGFVEAFLGIDRRVILFVGYLTYAIVQVLNALGLEVTSAYVSNGLLINQYGPQGSHFGPTVVITGLIWVFFVFYSAYDLVNEYRRTKDSFYRNRLRYLFLVVMFILAGTMSNLFYPLSQFPTDVGFNIISAFLIAIAILRHRLLDISFVVRKGLLYSIPTVVIGASYYLVILLALYIFPPKGIQIFLLSLTLAVIMALVMQPVRDKAQSWIDRLFFREKYDARLMLQRVSQTAAYVLDLDKLTHMLLAEVTSTLHIGKAAFFLKHQETDEFYLIAHVGFKMAPAMRWDKSHPIVQVLTGLDHPLTRHDLSVNPQFQALWEEERSALIRMGAELLIPLKVQDELVGIFILGPKLSEETYTEDDELLLMTLANQTAVSIENARLYSAEQSRREELDTLFQLARQLVVTDEVDAVIQSTVHHVVKSVRVTFARVLTIEEDGSYLCRAAFPIRALGYDLGLGRVEPPSLSRYYQRVIQQKKAMLFYRNNQTMSNEIRHDLMLDFAVTLCLSPLQIGEQTVGLLVLGERRDVGREPFDDNKMRMITAIADQAASALQRARLHEQMENSFLETILALANAMDARDTYIHNHSDALAKMVEAVCCELNCNDETLQAIRWAALLHDIGKIGVPDEILRKPGPLSAEEWTTMKLHPEIGAKIVAPIKKLSNVAPIIRAHQEHFDGSGYPDGLKGEQIPFGARVLAIVDAYGAMTDERVYRRAYGREEAINELTRCAGTQFDPALVDVFIRVIQKVTEKLA